jgi:serine protease Do
MTSVIQILQAEQDLAEIASSLREITVGVGVAGNPQGGEGAGVIWHREGLIVTNAHCVRQCRVTVRGVGGEPIVGNVVAHDARLDLALVEVPSLLGVPARLADVEALRTGEVLVAVGHPLGVRGALALGVLHGLARDPHSGSVRWVCADIRLAPGNSGGPLANAAGRIVGINAMVVGGLGLAIPVSVVERFIARVRPALAA